VEDLCLWFAERVGWCVRIAIACSRLQLLLPYQWWLIVDLSFLLLFRGTWSVLVGYERADYFLCWHTTFAKWFLMVDTWQGIATKRQRFECCYHRLSYMKTWMRPLRNKLCTSSEYLTDAFQQYVVVSATSVRRKYSETNERRMEELTDLCSLDANLGVLNEASERRHISHVRNQRFTGVPATLARQKSEETSERALLQESYLTNAPSNAWWYQRRPHTEIQR
jgi:hypothetical protein